MVDLYAAAPASLPADYKRKIVSLASLKDILSALRPAGPFAGGSSVGNGPSAGSGSSVAGIGSNGSGSPAANRPSVVGIGNGGNGASAIGGSNNSVHGEAAKTVVLCHGCFDIVHPGHIRYLRFARMQGDVLVVSITGDAAIDKGDVRPYIPQELRAENLAALEFVDYVVIDETPTACSLIAMIRPDVYVKGQEYATSKDPRFLAERQIVESYGGRVIFSSGDVVFSSSRLAEGMFQTPVFAAERLRLVCHRHGIRLDAMLDFLGAFRGKRLLIIGDLVVDRYVLCDATDIASESPMMSLTELEQKDYLGGAGVVAAQAAAWGAEPLLVTALGENGGRESDWAIKALVDAGVVIRAIRHRREMPRKTRYLVDDHKLFKVDRTPFQPLDSLGERKVADMLLSAAAHADAAVVFDSGFGMITPGVLQHLGGTFRRSIPVLTGGTAEPRGSLKSLRYFDLLCTSERKLRVATNDFGGGLSTLAYQMLDGTQARQMLVTLGKRGLVTFDRPSHDREAVEWRGRLLSEHLPALAGFAVDSLGCSESVLTAATLAAASGASLMQSAYFCSAVAAIQVGLAGWEPVGPDQLSAWMQRRPELAEPEEGEQPVFATPAATVPGLFDA